MPYLIDGNNLLYAICEIGPSVGRTGLCKLLGALIESDGRVCVIFDGPAPSKAIYQQMVQTRITVEFRPRSGADAAIIEHIQASTAPRRLIVVSSDRQIRKAARKRRCPSVRSEEFAEQLLKLVERSRRTPKPSEPKEKTAGLSEEQSRYWLKQFDIEQ